MATPVAERIRSDLVKILRAWRTLEVSAFILMIYIPDALSLWCLVKAIRQTLGVSDTFVLVGAASLSTLVPSGPAFLGTLQVAYALAIEFAGGARALGILVHGSGVVRYDIIARQQSDGGRADR